MQVSKKKSFQLGYACFKADLYSKALESYDVAERLNPMEHEIKESITLCREKTLGAGL
jgi:cytochrome c-type biogenesis protein CcmH/NrfG